MLEMALSILTGWGLHASPGHPTFLEVVQQVSASALFGQYTRWYAHVLALQASLSICRCPGSQTSARCQLRYLHPPVNLSFTSFTQPHFTIGTSGGSDALLACQCVTFPFASL